MTDRSHSLWQERRRLREKRLYFLLASAGTCIGFTITQIDKIANPLGVYLVVGAIACFGISFAAGIAVLGVDDDVLRANQNLLKMQRELSHELHPAIEDIAMKETFSPRGRVINFLYAIQVTLLFLGAAIVAASKLVECAGCKLAFGFKF